MGKGFSRKVIFLDLDHVLTNTDIDSTSFKHLDPSRYKLSKANMRWLDKILEKTGAKIVVASNWRKFSPPSINWLYRGKLYSSLLEPFKELYKSHIVGMLPPKRHTTKSECLELWFEDNPWMSKTTGKYVILEDDIREGYQENPFFAKHLILTDYHVGLTEHDADTAIEMLNGSIS